MLHNTPAVYKIGDMSYLNCISSSIPGCLSPHELEPISPSTQDASHERNPSPVPVAQIPTNRRFWDSKSWFVQEAHVDEDSAGKEGQGEVEERCVDDQVVHAWGQLVPLVIG